MSLKDKSTHLELNKKQAEFYNNTSKQKNQATRAWSYIRDVVLSGFRDKINIKNHVYETHEKWLGDLKDKKVLDLGCHRGNYLSIYMAKNSQEYVGIDLSSTAIDELKQKLINADCQGFEVQAVDFLSDQFEHGDFDIIYAYGVMHHFENVDVLIERLKEKLKVGGTVISYDPLKTSLPVKILRSIYRPFQSDRHWEWPFDRSTLAKIGNSFEIEERHGVLGKTKWGFLVSIFPIGRTKKMEVLNKWHFQDWQSSEENDSVLLDCMHVTMLLKNVDLDSSES